MAKQTYTDHWKKSENNSKLYGFQVLERKIGTKKWKFWSNVFHPWRPWTFMKKRRAIAMTRLLAYRNPKKEYCVWWWETNSTTTRHWLTKDKT